MSYPSPHEIKEYRQAKRSCIGFIAMVVLAIIAFVWLLCFVLIPEAHAADITGQSVYQTTNSDRKARGLKPLAPNVVLVKAAQAKADDMVKRDYFAHASPEKWHADHWVRALKGRQYLIGENLAAGFNTIEAQEAALMNSPTHRGNILDKAYTQIGIGIAHRSNGEIVVAVYFGAE